MLILHEEVDMKPMCIGIICKICVGFKNLQLRLRNRAGV